MFTLTARRLRSSRLQPGKLNKRRGVGQRAVAESQSVGGIGQRGILNMWTPNYLNTKTDVRGYEQARQPPMRSNVEKTTSLPTTADYSLQNNNHNCFL